MKYEKSGYFVLVFVFKKMRQINDFYIFSNISPKQIWNVWLYLVIYLHEYWQTVNITVKVPPIFAISVALLVHIQFYYGHHKPSLLAFEAQPAVTSSIHRLYSSSGFYPVLSGSGLHCVRLTCADNMGITMNMCHNPLKLGMYGVKVGNLFKEILIISLDRLYLVFMEFAVFILKLLHFKQDIFHYLLLDQSIYVHSRDWLINIQFIQHCPLRIFSGIYLV